MHRRSSFIGAGLALSLLPGATGCFSPNVSNDDGTEGGNSGTAETTATPTTATEPTPETGTTAPSSSTTTSGMTTEDLDETGVDSPPIIEGFTVDGSTRPAELTSADTIVLEVDASDDQGIATMEFFDGDESLAVIEDGDSLEIFLTSADSGSHSYRVVVTDTGGQTTESETIVLSVNIVGGQIEILREDLFTGSDLLGAFNGSIVATSENRVYVTTALLEGTGYAIAFSAELSQIWAEGGPRQLAPVVVNGETVVIPGYDSSAETWVFRTVDPDDGATLDSLSFSIAGETSRSLGPRAANIGGNIVLPPDMDTLVSYAPNLKDVVWTKNLSFEAAEITKMTAASDGGLLLSIRSDSCTLSADRCVAKLRPDGTTEWTAGLDAYPTGPIFADSRPEGGAIVAAQIEDGYTVWILAGDGAEQESTSFLNGDNTLISDIAADGQGGALVSGNVGYDGGDAFVIRLDSSLVEIWEQTEFFPTNDSIATSVTVIPGAVFVLGLESLSADGLFGVTGSGWAARLSL